MITDNFFLRQLQQLAANGSGTDAVGDINPPGQNSSDLMPSGQLSSLVKTKLFNDFANGSGGQALYGAAKDALGQTGADVLGGIGRYAVTGDAKNLYSMGKNALGLGDAAAGTAADTAAGAAGESGLLGWLKALLL